MIKAIAAASAIFAMTATATLEAAVPLLQPVPYGTAILRHHQGQPTIELRGRNGAIEVTPLAMDHGCVNFGITVFNRSNRASDIDLSDVSVSVGEAPAHIFTVNELQKRANHRAFWTSMAVAAVSGVAAGVVAASSSHATIRSSGPYGTRVSRITYHDGYNSANAAIIGASGAAAAGSIQANGRRDAAQIGDEILALTTVDPGDAYGGRVVIDKIKAPLPQAITVRVEWNGDAYVSKWQLVPEGTPAPLFGEAPVEAVAEPAASARIQRAILMEGPKPQAMPEHVRPVTATRPKQYPQDDTVQVPM